MALTPFAKLPVDCWLLILEQLPFQELLSLSKTSRDLRDSAEPYLYRSIHWDWSNPPLDRVLMLLRTIAERPHVASYIWHVSMNNWGAVYEVEGNFQLARAKGAWMKKHQRFRPTLRWARMLVRSAKYPPKMEQKWVSLLANGNEYAYATVLLSLLHNLRSLRLDFSFVAEHGLPGMMLYHSLFANVPPGLLSKFTKLEMVDYGGNAPLINFESSELFGKNHQFMPWFHLPSLKILEIWLPNIEGITWLTEPSAMLHSPPLLSLRSLIITRSSASAEELGTLLSKVPSLSSVHVGMAYRCVATSDFLKESPHLLAALEAKLQTLQHLSISLEVMPGCAENYHIPIDGSISSEPFRGFLNKFPKLQTVEIPLNFLLGWGGAKYRLQDVLPRDVTTIHIRPDFWVYEDMPFFSSKVHKAVMELLGEENHPLQSLREISYEGPPNDHYGWDDYQQSTVSMVLAEKVTYAACKVKGIWLMSRHRFWMPGNMAMRGQWPQGAPVKREEGICHNMWPFLYEDKLPPFMKYVF